MTINKIGGFCLLIGILLIFINYKIIDYASIAILTPLIKEKTVDFFFQIRLPRKL